jgi:hypothetical protein
MSFAHEAARTHQDDLVAPFIRLAHVEVRLLQSPAPVAARRRGQELVQASLVSADARVVPADLARPPASSGLVQTPDVRLHVGCADQVNRGASEGAARFTQREVVLPLALALARRLAIDDALDELAVATRGVAEPDQAPRLALVIE